VNVRVDESGQQQLPFAVKFPSLTGSDLRRDLDDFTAAYRYVGFNYSAGVTTVPFLKIASGIIFSSNTIKPPLERYAGAFLCPKSQ
jgi:hypothetical protein